MTRPLLALLLVACTNPFIPEGTARIDPPPEYRVWWEASRACINRPEFRAFEDIEWYWSPDLLKGSDGEDALGLTIENRVYLFVDVAQTPWVIQHELVHAINRLGAHPHPYDPFVTCGLMPTTSASVLHSSTREAT